MVWGCEEKTGWFMKYGTELAIFIIYNMMCNIMSYRKVQVQILTNDSYCDLTKYS